MNSNPIMKLKDSIPTNAVKIIDLYNKIDNDLLDTSPDYQRKLVWKKQHKFAFIDTILKNFPFPEIYIASSDIDVEKRIATEVVVDGKQRLTAIVDYIKGEGDFEDQKKVTAFDDLSTQEKKDFLNYKVSVKDLKDISEGYIKEIFRRINSTEYSLNIVERNNAQYGDGEIALFCKQLTELEYNPTKDKTDIIIDKEKRNFVYNFFNSNEVFTDNDKKRMYDFQYLMLLTATILEGSYFGRNTKVDEYLKKYNSEFPDYEIVINKLTNSIGIILKLDFSKISYWYNKANLFTLLIELSKVQVNSINVKKLEPELFKLEDKADIYFTADNEEEIEDISEDEKKYFEVARHSSHEKAEREHRGKVIGELIDSCIKCDNNHNNSLEILNKDYFESKKKISYSVLIPTKTGLKKSIMDAVSSVRDFLEENNIHNYDAQELGPDHKIVKDCFLQYDKSEYQTKMSLYRSNGRGDYRIWINNLRDFVSPDQELALILEGTDKIKVLNISKYDYRPKIRKKKN